MLSLAEENYLKTILKLQQADGLSQQSADNQPTDQGASTNQIAEHLQTRAGSVSEMLKKLADKELVHYQPYQGVKLTVSGKSKALQVVRRHRLWETFLVQTLGFDWDEVHELAEELEHIRSEELIKRLDAFLKHPRFDPHGDPIPDSDGVIRLRSWSNLSSVPTGTEVILTGVADHSPDFLRYLQSQDLNIGAKIVVDNKIGFDGSCQLTVNQQHKLTISAKVAEHILVVNR